MGQRSADPFNMRLLGVLLLLSVAYTQALWVPAKRDHDPFHNECGIDAGERQGCGRRFDQLGELECLARSCCWDGDPKLEPGAVRCFLAKRMLTEKCAVEYEDKDDCGYYGISEGECINRGCCYKPSPLANDPVCFQPVYDAVRLVNGTTEKSGRVEIQHEDNWGTVCDDGFGQQEADVICRSLGYATGVAKMEAYYGQGTGNILLDDLGCKGTEAKLEDCRHSGWGNHNCGHQEDAGVNCLNEGEEEVVEVEEDDEDEYGASGGSGATEEDWDYRSMRKPKQ